MGIGRTRGKLHSRTQIVGAALTVAAAPARAARLNGHRRAGLEAVDGGADGVHGAGGFVAHGQGLGVRDVDAVDAAVVPEMHVAAADANVADADDDVGRIGGVVEGGERVVLDFGRARPV